MCGGGSIPADNSLAIQQAQFAREDELRRQEEARQAAEEARRRTQFGVDIEAAITGARSGAEQRLGQRGLATDEFMPLINSEISRIRTTVPDLATNPSSYFSPDLADTVLSREENARRANYNTTLRNTFTPSYYTDAFGDTADDPFLEAIVGSQYDQTLAGVERARARGTLGPGGYDAALRKLTGARSGASARAQEIGGTVLERNRTSLRNVADEGFSGASNYALGTTFDPSQYINRATSLRSDLSGRLEGDIRNAIGGTEFFDLGDIIGFGAREQGAQNNPNTPLAEVLAQRASSRNSKRGIGSTGSF